MDMKTAFIATIVLAVLIGGFVFWKKQGANTVDAPLVSTKWYLTNVDGTDVAAGAPDRTPNFVLETDNRITGFSGCNRMTGSYILIGNKLSFPGNIAMTRMACAQGADVEQNYAKSLQATNSWEIDGSELTLKDKNGKTLATFQQAAP